MPNAVAVAPPLARGAGLLANHRKGRYRGDDLCLPLTEFAPADRAFVAEAYQILEGLFAPLLRHHLAGTDETQAQALACVADQNADALIDCVRPLGVESLQFRPSELMAETVHDLRGGAMSALIGELQLAELRPLSDLDLRRLFFLTRDHLKMMRNALLGLDDAKRQADLIPKMHSVDLIAEKWQHAVIGPAERQTRLEVDCDFHGNIAECCVEFGALDRVLYNLVNNACRHTASGEVKLAIQSFPEGELQPESLCFQVSNPVRVADERTLVARGDLSVLFQPGVSSTGSGYGLTVAVDFVTNAFGLKARADALAGGYLGAQCVEQEFLAWFHWPVVADV